jgi:mannose-6-phosphate isomerase-like protein (cupin superfamily)
MLLAQLFAPNRTLRHGPFGPWPHSRFAISVAPMNTNPIPGRRCFWVAGVQISYLSGACGNGGEPDIVEHFVPPGAGPPFFLHASRTDAFYVIHGNFRFRCGANDATLKAGQFLMLPQGLPHLYENVGDDWGRLLNIITPGGLEPLHLELDQASRHAPIDCDRFLEINARHGVTIVNCDFTGLTTCRPESAIVGYEKLT